ncbi:MAG: hypothetical protein P8P29_02620 [Flavobacteriaceae bacterium]|nr:hypothetical protein [Flavobacteriaceae bacterium]
MIGMITGSVSGLANIAGGIIGSRKRKREQREAQKQMNMRMAQFEMADTSNLYKDMENTMEDLTVNTQQADFQAQQANQGIANTMNTMQGAAGGSGIAAMAQAMAGQQAQNMRQASVSIGQQEQANQMAERQQADALAMRERRGEEDSRRLERQKTNTLLGMSQQRLSAANAAREQAKQSIMSGVGDMFSGAMSGAASGIMGDKVPELLGKTGDLPVEQ